MTDQSGVVHGRRSTVAWLAASVAIAGALIMPAIAEASNPGAIWTTTSTCGPVNVNNYASKVDVYLNGGPDGSGASGLPDGSYWVEVIVPGGVVLGRSSSAVVAVVDGRMAQCYQLWAITRQAPAFTQVGYLDTTNPGGSYNVLVSQDPGFVGGTTKNDHFKVGPPTTTTSTTTSSASTTTTSTTTTSTTTTTTTASTSTVSTTTTSGTHITSTTTPATSATTSQTSTTSTGATAVVSGITGGPTTGGEVEGISAGPILPPTTTDADSRVGGTATSLILLLLAGAGVILSMGWPLNARLRR